MRPTVKRILRLLLLAPAIALTACDGGALTPKSGGAPYEVLVVGDADSLLTRVLQMPAEGLTPPEPSFDVSTADRLTQLTRTARNIVILETDPTKYPHTRLRYEQNPYAAPQLIVHVQTPSTHDLRRFLLLHADKLLQLLTEQELLNEQARLQKAHSAVSERAVREASGLEMLLPADLTATKRGDGFLWLSDDGGASNRSLCFYRLPRHSLPSAPDIGTRFAHLRDSVMRLHLPGEREGMWMETAPTPLLPQRTTLRGQWQMHGDMMGGPFVAHLIDRGDSIIVAEAFVYAPGAHKRNRLRALEAALATATPLKQTKK